MGLKEANIHFDNQWNTYYAGQTVNGRIEYVFDSPKKVRGILVKFKGEAHTDWTESKEEQDSEGKTQTTDQHHTGNEEYFQITYNVLGSSNGGEIDIPAGQQVYNFTCTLPPVLPSSFEGQYGYVRYTVKVILDRPWKFNQETKAAFTVINPLDLNLNPSYRQPIHMQMEKVFCCFCCVSAPLSVDARAPVSGYCPGQSIPLTLDIDNKSNVELELIKVFLRKVVTYRATSPTNATKKSKDIVLTLQQGPVPAGSAKTWTLMLEVPPIPPSNLVNCSIIDLDYDLKVECVVSGMHMNLKDKKYVTIGTVPLVGRGGPTDGPGGPVGQTSPGSPAVLPVAPSAPPADGPGWQAPNSLYPALPPAVLSATPYAARSIRDVSDGPHVSCPSAAFAPHYPVYAAPPPLPQ